MKQVARQQFDDLMRVHQNLMTCIEEFRDAIKSNEESTEELCDMAYFCREVARTADNIRKEATKCQELIGRVVTYRWATSPGDPPRNYKTTFCTATPEVKTYIPYPSKKNEPEKYAAVMNYLGIPSSLYSDGAEVIKLNYPGWLDYASEFSSAGKPIPSALVQKGEEQPVYSLKITKRKHI